METIFSGTAHGSEGPERSEDRFLAGLCAFSPVAALGCRAPMCAEGGLRTWERDPGRYRIHVSA